ncbi:hypothetical protein HPB50_018701 [Hyalomma asiaticum]|uniref:Uncharacterized protein n=1 Tax=Hyalomma asiaticum TaxID=266040 RepID=A0ACB7RXC8_HYAAI|nr:hypothetical protein HPB50_018701 [Hyalomma asiaticum]
MCVVCLQVDPWAWPSNRGRAVAQVARNAGDSRSPRGANRRAANGIRDDQESSMSSSVLRACSAQYYNACLPPGDAIHRSGSANQLNGHHAQPQSSPSSQQVHATATSAAHHQTAVGMSNATSLGPARPQRTHS